MDLENLRRSYEESSLVSDDLAKSPIQQFETWFQVAQETTAPDWLEINAMTLATAVDGRVSARVVLLKQFSASGFVFFTNYDSDKGRQLALNPLASLVFYWPHVERQVRIEGQVSKTDSATSDHYFHARPRGSQLGAVASPQSRSIASREELVEATMKLAEQNEGGKIPRPDYWGGFLLKPNRMEFWQGRPSRLHDRFVYEIVEATDNQAASENWSLQRLAP